MFSGQKYAETTRGCPRVASLVLCNSFTDTAIFRYNDEATAMWLLPTLALKRMVMSGLQMGNTDVKISEATEFILERLDSLGHSDLASRLTLSCLKGFVEPQNVNDLPVTIIDVFDECSLTQVSCFIHYYISSQLKIIFQDVRDETYKFYPSAKLAHLKTGGNFPYLSRTEEINMFLLIHLRNFETAVA